MSSNKVTGVYKITNPEGKIYIGASKDVHQRMHKGYKCKLGNNKRIRLIDKSIIEYGHKNHVFEVVEYCSIDELNERERHYQEYFDCLWPNGLNRNLVACKGKRQVASSATKELIRECKTGLIPWNIGIPMWESTKKTIAKRYDALKRPHTRIIMDKNTGVFYYGVRDAARGIGIPPMTLKANLTAPNIDCRKNKTNLIYV